MRANQVPATWFPATQDPPPGVARTAPLSRGAVLVLGRSRGISAELPTGRIETARRGTQGALGLEQIGGHPVGRFPVQLTGHRLDPTTQLVQIGGDGGELGVGC